MTRDGRDSIPGSKGPIGDSWAYSSRYDDIDAQAAHFRGFGQHYQQLSAGRFNGQFQSFNFGSELTIHLEGANRELVQAATTPRGRFGLSVVAENSPPCVLNAATVGQEDMIFYPAGRTIEGKTPERMRIFCIDLDSHLLVDEVDEASGARIVHDALKAIELRDVVASGLANFQALGGPSSYPAAACGFISSIAELVCRVSDCARTEPPRVRRRARARALVVYGRARDRLIDELSTGISITKVCKAVGVSRRSLECAFRSVVGMSPAHYVRTLQLNCIRRDLLSGGELHTSIGVIAARHGVWHWSRCSQAYRRLFGELPSETRRRVLLDAS
jgi:AraC family transcriptional regulator, ethanolamine operon transcriptional activator